MRWTLAACCGFVLISLSVTLQIHQRPRFYGSKPSKHVVIYCQLSQQDLNSTVEWHKADTYGAVKKKIQHSERIGFQSNDRLENIYLYFKEIKVEDSGVYFCSVNDTWGPGSEIQIIRPVSLIQAKYRSQMKDGLIFLQGLLLAVCIAAYVLRKQKMGKDSDSLYEEPETDHIYEGLAIETCGGDLYEDLSAYAQAEGAEAPWE